MSTVIALFDDRSQAERAVKEIKDVGISEREISIVSKEENFGDENDQGMKMTTGATTGGTIGGLAGLMAGAGALAIPGIGPILAAGPIAAGLTGMAAGGLIGGLADLGIPRERGEHYENELKSGSILTAVKTGSDKVEKVANSMRKNGARDVETH
ncbi:MAG: general stress protein [Bacillota bacterium]